MAHKEWCGKSCSECTSPCTLDQSIPCSPDCEALNEDGTRNTKNCQDSGCDAVVEKEGICPVCNNEDLSYGHSEILDNCYVYEWSCRECGVSGKECYNLVFSTHLLD